MSNFKVSSTALSCLLLIPSIANCLELGKVDVYSGLHENLNSKIALHLSPDDLNSKSIVEIAPADKMLQAGIVFNDNLHKIHVKRVGTSINVFSSSALENPKVDLLLKISSDKEVKYRRVNLNLNDLSEVSNALIAPVLLSGHDTNLLNQAPKKKKIDYGPKYQLPKKKIVEYNIKNQPASTVATSLPIAEAITNNDLPASNTVSTSTNNEVGTTEQMPIVTNNTQTYIASQATETILQPPPKELPLAPIIADKKAPTLVEQIKALEKFKGFDLIAFIIGILSILGYQRFKRPKPLQKTSQQDHDTSAYEFTYNANTVHKNTKIDNDYRQSQILDQLRSNQLDKPKEPHVTDPYVSNNTDDFDFKLDFNLPVDNKFRH